MSSSSTKRFKPEIRRELLLDAAQEVLVERGLSGITMEGIAARAGVNKALPYRHFENADAVVVELFVRFNHIIGSRVVTAIASHDTLEGRIRATVATYFDVVRDHGALLSVVMDRGSDIHARASKATDAHHFVTGLVVGSFGVRRRDADAVADVLQGILAAAATSWAKKHARRAQAETLAASACLAVIRAATTG